MVFSPFLLFLLLLLSLGIGLFLSYSRRPGSEEFGLESLALLRFGGVDHRIQIFGDDGDIAYIGVFAKGICELAYEGDGLKSRVVLVVLELFETSQGAL